MKSLKKKYSRPEKSIKPDVDYKSMSSYLLSRGNQKNRKIFYKQILDHYLGGGFDYILPGKSFGLLVGEQGRREIDEFLHIDPVAARLEKAKRIAARQEKKEKKKRKNKIHYDSEIKVDPSLLPYQTDDEPITIKNSTVRREIDYFKDEMPLMDVDEQFKREKKVTPTKIRKYIQSLMKKNPTTLLRATELRDKYGLPLERMAQMHLVIEGCSAGYRVSEVIPVLESLLSCD